MTKVMGITETTLPFLSCWTSISMFAVGKKTKQKPNLFKSLYFLDLVFTMKSYP